MPKRDSMRVFYGSLRPKVNIWLVVQCFAVVCLLHVSMVKGGYVKSGSALFRFAEDGYGRATRGVRGWRNV